MPAPPPTSEPVCGWDDDDSSGEYSDGYMAHLQCRARAALEEKVEEQNKIIEQLRAQLEEERQRHRRVLATLSGAVAACARSLDPS